MNTRVLLFRLYLFEYACPVDMIDCQIHLLIVSKKNTHTQNMIGNVNYNVKMESIGGILYDPISM